MRLAMMSRSDVASGVLDEIIDSLCGQVRQRPISHALVARQAYSRESTLGAPGVMGCASGKSEDLHLVTLQDSDYTGNE